MIWKSVRRFAIGIIIVVGCSSCNRQSETTTPKSSSRHGIVYGRDCASRYGCPIHFTVTYSSAYTDASITVTSLKTVANGTSQSITIGVGFWYHERRCLHEGFVTHQLCGTR